MIVLLVAVGGAVGAPLRYFTDRWVQERHDSVFPWGTMSVNVVAGLVLGVLVGSAASPDVTALVGTGFCGALSTYSTFSFETYRLLVDRAYLLAAFNVGVSLLAGLGAAFVGLSIGGWQ